MIKRQTFALGLGLLGAISGPVARARPLPLELLLRESRYELDMVVDFQSETLHATADLTLENRGDGPADRLHLLLYRLLGVTRVQGADGEDIPFVQQVVAVEDQPKRQVNYLQVPIEPSVPPGGRTVIRITYSGYLLGYTEVGWLYVKDRIDPEFTILRVDCLAFPEVGVPSNAVNRAAGFPAFDYEARITVPADKIVANGGALIDRFEKDGLATYRFRNLKPAWRMDFAISDFRVLAEGAHRVYYFPADAEGAVGVMDALTQTIDLYTRWFGPLAGAAGFSVIEIPDGWGSQADVTSILQTAAAFRDPERRYEIYHEISHLWNVPPLDDSPRWNEGLASFLQYLTADRLGGDRGYEQQVVRYLERIRERSAEDRRLAEVAMIDYGKEQITDLSYRVGMVMFALLYRLVGQEEFNEIVGGFYQRYHDKGGTTGDFVAHADAVTSLDLERFFHDWIYTTRWHALVAEGASFEDLATTYGGG